MSDALVVEMADSCIVTRARLVSRVVSGIYDNALREFGINSPQFILLVIISKLGPVTSAALGRFHQQDRSTLSRNLKIMSESGWIEEAVDAASGRSRPLIVTAAGRKLLADAEAAWRSSQAEATSLLGAKGVSSISQMGDSLLDRSGL